METVHQYPNIKELEAKLGTDSIELYIETFGEDIELVNDAIDMKAWEEYDIDPIKSNNPLDQAVQDVVLAPYCQLEDDIVRRMISSKMIEIDK